MIEQVPVTSLPRTLIDLVLYADRYEECLVWMRLLAAEMPALLAPVREHLRGRPRLPGRRAALAYVDELSGAASHFARHEDVTR